MTLEEILKSLKKGECKKCETTDDCHRVIEVLRMADEGSYVVTFNVDSYDYRCDIGLFTSIEGLFECIRDMYPLVEWTEFDYEFYKDRSELKEENTQLKEALKKACECVDCELCPLYPLPVYSCGGETEDCSKYIYKYFLNEVKENDT